MRIRGRAAIKRTALGVHRVVKPALDRLGVDSKGFYEYAYWKSKQIEESELGNQRYAEMFTADVGLTTDFYRDKRILDIGCGPRGSLEWAGHAAERVGLDPLVGKYRRLGIDRHEMDYVEAPAEEIPFPDGHFDVVTSFNSLDHVDDVPATVAEIVRVLAPGGTFVLVVDVHEKPTIAEPHAIPWDFADHLRTWFDIVEERHLERPDGADYLRENLEFDHTDTSDRYGVLVIRARRKADP